MTSLFLYDFLAADLPKQTANQKAKQSGQDNPYYSSNIAEGHVLREHQCHLPRTAHEAIARSNDQAAGVGRSIGCHHFLQRSN